MSSTKVLYVDDEEKNLRVFEASFYLDFDILTAKSGKDALKIMDQNNIAVIITDQRMPEMTGVDLLKKVKQKYANTVRIILTGFSDMSVIKEAVNECGIFKYMEKPWDAVKLKITIQEAIAKYK